jgi:hypothetical protein
VTRTNKRLAAAAARRPRERDPLVYDADWDEDARLAQWGRLVDQTQGLPPTLATAIVVGGWNAIEPLQHFSWIGRLLGAAMLRQLDKTRAHLACLNTGLRQIPLEQRRSRQPDSALVAQLEAIRLGAQSGLKDHDRWLARRYLLERKLKGRRTTSKLPALIDLVFDHPLVSTTMIAKALGVTPRAAQDLVAALALPETTGRSRYRVWGIF